MTLFLNDDLRRPVQTLRAMLDVLGKINPILWFGTKNYLLDAIEKGSKEAHGPKRKDRHPA